VTRRSSTEIMEFNSLQEVVTMLEGEISHYQTLKDTYSTQLGILLREAEDKHRDEEWFKKLSLGEKLPKEKAKAPKKEKKGGGAKKKGKKGKKGEAKENWIPFQDLQLSSTVQGEAELMFEAIDQIAAKIEELQASKTAMEELRNVGLGGDVSYMIFIREGAPKRIVFKLSEAGAMEKFVFARGFTAISLLQP